MTQDYTLILIFAFSGIMLWLTVKDHKSFLRDQPINYKLIIVSIGVLGTFLGVVLGLFAFDSQNIKDSVPQLLEGLKLVFVTTIIGMGLSVFLSVLQAKQDEKSKPDPIATLLSEIKLQLEKLDKRSETLNETVAAILENLKDLKSDIYQGRSRFIKLDSNGQTLPDEATQWAAVFDNETGLTWEVKTNDGGLQDGQHTYSWDESDGGGNNMAAYVEAVNQLQVAGYKDWRLPTIDEMESLIRLNKRYFPNIQSYWYCSSTFHPNEDGFLWLLSFQTEHRGYNRGYGHVLLTRKDE